LIALIFFCSLLESTVLQEFILPGFISNLAALDESQWNRFHQSDDEKGAEVFCERTSREDPK